MRPLLALGLGLLGFAQAASAPAFQDLDMVSANIGWGLASTGVYRTQDGGQHWKDVSFRRPAPETSCTLARGATPNVAWVTCSPLRADLVTKAEGHLYRTATAGECWNSSPLPLGGGPRAQRIDERYGYVTTAVAQGMGHVDFGFARTLDGGRSWQVRHTANPGPLGQNGQTYPTYDGTGNGYLAISPWGREGLMYVVKSPNAGRSWQSIRVPAPEATTVLAPETPAVFGKAVIVPTLLRRLQDTGGDSFAWYVSGDGGRTFHMGQRVPFSPLPDQAAQLTASLLSARQGFVVAGASLYRTGNAGAQWARVGPVPAQPARALDFVNARAGWLLTEKALYRTRDGGAHWEKLR